MTYYVAEVTLAIDAAGTLRTELFGNFDATLSGSSTPAHRRVYPRLVQPANWSQVLNADAPFGVPETGYGVASILNRDKRFDWMARAGAGFQSYVLRARDTLDGVYPDDWTTCRVASMDRIELSSEVLQLYLRDEMQAVFRQPMCKTYGGTGGLDGVAAIKDEAVPRIYGCPWNFTPKLIDGGHIYQLSDRPHTFGNYSFDGRAYISNVSTAFNAAADFAALVALAVPPGHVVRCADSSLIKLGSRPSFQLTVDASRMTAGYAGSLFERTFFGKVLQDMVADAGLPPERLGAGVADLPRPCSFAASDTSTTYQDGMDACARGVAGYVYMDHLNVVQAGLWAEPAGEPVVTFRPTGTTLDGFTFRQRVPNGRILGQGARNWTPLERERLHTSLIDDFGFDNLAWVGQEYAGTTKVGAVPAKHRNATDYQHRETGYHNNAIGAALPNLRGAAYAATVQALIGVERDLVTITQPIDLVAVAAVRIGSVVRLVWPRHGLDGGKLFRVYGVAYDHARNAATYHLWA